MSVLKVLTYFFHVAYPYLTKLRKNNAECGRCVPNGGSLDWNYLFAANAVANDLAIAGSAKHQRMKLRPFVYRP